MLNNLIRFVANTKAKASEVNYNFDQVKAKIQELDDWKTSTDDKLNKYSSFQLFDLIVTDRVLTGEEAKGKLLQGSLVTNLYPDAVAKIKNEWDNGAEQTYTYGEDISFPYRLAANRHMIVDILYKDDVDALFAATGVAWFYIWDNANEQFYLPRSLWFDQYTNDPEKVNKYNEAGLPNITSTATGFGITTPEHCSGASKATDITAETLSPGHAQGKRIDFDSSLSNSIYGKSNTVQPPSSNKLLYFVVGNTYVNQEDIDIAQVESEINNIDAAKLNITLDNATQTTINALADKLIPKYSEAIQLDNAYGVEKTYEVVAYGRVNIKCVSINNIPAYINLNGQKIASSNAVTGNYTQSCTADIIVRPGDVVAYKSTGDVHTNNTEHYAYFYPY